eukprot:1157298-Pelagomonas_calceolata.AAC.8
MSELKERCQVPQKSTLQRYGHATSSRGQMTNSIKDKCWLLLPWCVVQLEELFEGVQAEACCAHIQNACSTCVHGYKFIMGSLCTHVPGSLGLDAYEHTS